MEQQNSHPSNLLDITDTESGVNDEVSKDFFEQNQMISEEMSKYDQLLSTCPMMMYRIWIIATATWTLAGCSYIVLNFNAVLASMQFLFKNISYLMLLLMVFASSVTLWGCILTWIALHSKNLQKMERALAMFKLSARFTVVIYACLFVFQLVEGVWHWILPLSYLVAILFTFINVFPAIRLRNILAARNVFDQVSSFPNKK